MRTKKITRHYCDFCSKGGFFRAKMEAHEKGCTANPNRVCGMCRVAGEDQQPAEVLEAAMQKDVAAKRTQDSWGVEIELDALRVAANHCPSCILATIRKTDICFAFNVKDEFRAFWAEHNNDGS